MQLLKQISEFLQQGDDQKVFELTRLAIDQKVSPQMILQKGLIGGMNEISRLFKNHEIFLPEVLLVF